MSHDLINMQRVKQRVCHGVLLTYALIMSAILGSSLQGDLFRNEEGSYHPLLFVHIGILSGVWILLFLRRHIPYRISAAYLCFVFLFAGLVSIYEFGLIGPGSAWLLSAPMLASVFFDKKAGLFFLLTAIGGYLLIGHDTIGAARLPPVDLSYYVLHTGTWAAHVFSFLVVAALLIAASTTVNTHLTAALKAANIREKEIEERIEIRTKELNVANERLAKISREDPLTELLNRRSFVEAATHDLERSQRSEEPLSVLLLDADHFKTVNDTYGHAGGDMILIAIADLLRASLRKTDIIGRLGGEEFAAILPDTPVEDAQLVAENLRKAIEAHSVSFGGKELKVTTSIGLSSANQSDTLETLLHRADTAMYDAKDSGRNKVVTH